MEEYSLNEESRQKEGIQEYGEISSSEEAFMRGYMEEGNVEECEEMWQFQDLPQIIAALLAELS